MRSLNRPQAMAILSPCPSRRPAYTVLMAIQGRSRRRPDRGRSQDVVQTREQMTHAFLLGAEIVDVLRVGLRLERDPLHHLQTEAVKTTVLGRIVGQIPHGGDAKIDEDLGADAVLAAVDGKAELEVGVDGVEAGVLQGI